MLSRRCLVTMRVMPVMVEMHNTGDPAIHSEIAAAIEHVLSDRVGDWKVSLMGSQENDRWEMNIQGPNAFERSYILEGSAGEHRAEVIIALLEKMLPPKTAMQHR
jgi:hypothetical protein